MIKEMCIAALNLLEKFVDPICECADNNGWDRDELFMVLVYYMNKALEESTLKETEEPK